VSVAVIVITLDAAEIPIFVPAFNVLLGEVKALNVSTVVPELF
jgi:hypothetical protein